MTRTLLLTVALLALSACSADTPTPDAPPAIHETAPEAAPAEAAVDFGPLADLAKAIAANPADVDALLADADYTIDRFEAELVAIARDPAKSKAWAEQVK